MLFSTVADHTATTAHGGRIPIGFSARGSRMMKAFRPQKLDGERLTFCVKNSGAGFLTSCGKIAACALLALVGGFAEAAGDFEKGVELYFAGDNERAREIILPLADAGDAKAQFYAGVLTLGDEEVWLDYMEKAAVQCLPEAIEFMLHYAIIPEETARLLGETAHYAECAREAADYPAARYVLAQLEAHGLDGEVGEDSSVAELLAEEVENLTLREALLVGAGMMFTLGERGDALPYFAHAAGMGDYKSVEMLATFSSGEEEKFWGGVKGWFDQAMGDATKISADDAVAEYVRANYLDGESGFRALYDRARRLRGDIPNDPDLRNCVTGALNADYENMNYALREHWDKYRASWIYQKHFEIGCPFAVGSGGRVNFSWRALGRVRPLVEKHLLARK